MVTDRELQRSRLMKRLGGTHSVKLYDIGNDYVVCKEYPLWMPNRMAHMENEILAYKLSKKLGLDLVPKTVFVKNSEKKLFPGLLREKETY